MEPGWERLLAFVAVLTAFVSLWFFIFWPWFSFWRKHRVLAYLMLATTFVVGGLLLRGLEHWTWFGGRLGMPVWARTIGWVLIAISAVFGFVADRQIGLRVRSFTPFFQKQGRIQLKTTGAYGVVRHPIYAAGRIFQLGIFLVTGYPSVLLAYLVFGLGSIWFSRREEEHLKDLLDDPTEYDRYRERVPALFPFLRRSSA